METNNKKISSWINKIDFTQRNVIGQMYQNGIKITTISTIYGVDRSSIYYHLRNAGVYIKNKKGEIDIRDVKAQNRENSLELYRKKYNKSSIEYRIWENSEKNFPKSYKDYVQREINRNSILYKNGIPDIQTKIPESKHDSDAFWKRRRRSPADIDARREKIANTITNTSKFKDTITEENSQRFDNNSESISQGKVSQFVSITF